MTSRTSASDLLHVTPRFAGVAGVLARHGFAGLLRGEGGWPSPDQVRRALEELGVVYLKLGQVLSTRRDILPPGYIAELEKLQDRLPPEADATIREQIERELGAPPEEVFREFEWSPIAAATIAQVHGARLRDGRDIVVKVQRPALQARIKEDLAVIAYLGAVLDLLVPKLRPFAIPEIVSEFHESLLKELDFEREARNVRRFRAALSDTEGIWIPDVIEEYSTSRVITFERSHGVRVAVYADEHPELRSELARRLVSIFLRQVFAEGLFHADPHPGNFFVLPDGTLCLHDFGMIGEIDPPLREALVELLESVVAGDALRAAESYFRLGLVGPDVDRRAIETEIGNLLREIRERPLAEVSVGDALGSLLRLGSRHRIRNPGVLLLLCRAFITLEAVIRDLDPELSVIEAFRDVLPSIMGDRFMPGRILTDGTDVARQLDRLIREAPWEIRTVLRRLAAGDVGSVQVAEHGTVIDRRERSLSLILRTVAAGFLMLTGAILARSPGWRLVIGGVLLTLGLAGLVVTALRVKVGRYH